MVEATSSGSSGSEAVDAADIDEMDSKLEMEDRLLVALIRVY